MTPFGSNKNHPVYSKNDELDWIYNKYHPSNIDKGENLLYWQEPLINSQ